MRRQSASTSCPSAPVRPQPSSLPYLMCTTHLYDRQMVVFMARTHTNSHMKFIRTNERTPFISHTHAHAHSYIQFIRTNDNFSKTTHTNHSYIKSIPRTNERPP